LQYDQLKQGSGDVYEHLVYTLFVICHKV